MLTLRKSSDSDKQRHTKSQAKACSSMSCTLFCVYGVHGFYALYFLFAVRQNKMDANIKIVMCHVLPVMALR